MLHFEQSLTSWLTMHFPLSIELQYDQFLSDFHLNQELCACLLLDSIGSKLD